MTKRNPHLDELKSRAAAFRPTAKPRRQELSTSTRLAAVRYNHRPDIENPDDSTLSIIQNEHGKGIMLSLKDGDEEYEFQGQSHDDHHTFILLPAAKY